LFCGVDRGKVDEVRQGRAAGELAGYQVAALYHAEHGAGMHVEQFGGYGRIDVASEEGIGSTFTVTLPVTLEPIAAA